MKFLALRGTERESTDRSPGGLSAFRDLADDVTRARQILGTHTEPDTVSGIVRNLAGDAVFAQSAGEVLGHRFIFAGPGFRGRFARVPIVGQGLFEGAAIAIEPRLIIG